MARIYFTVDCEDKDVDSVIKKLEDIARGEDFDLDHQDTDLDD